MNRIAWVIVGGLSLGLVGGCQTDDADAVDENTPISGPTASSGQGKDAAFMRNADIINNAEVQIGQLAIERGQNPDIRRFAEMLVNDHQDNRQKLQQLAQTQDVQLSAGLDQKHRQTLDRLSQLQGAEFDRAFIDEMVKGHQDAISKFEEQVRTGQDPQAKSYAADTLPALRHHLQFAKDIQSRLKGDMSGSGAGMQHDMHHQPPTGNTGTAR
jgi:putative membrane protein